jgi:hypothetical protein
VGGRPDGAGTAQADAEPKTPALPAAAHRRPDRPRPTPTEDQIPRPGPGPTNSRPPSTPRSP